MSKYVGKKTEILVLRPLIEHGCKVSIGFYRPIPTFIFITVITPSNHYELSFGPIMGYWNVAKLQQADINYFDNIISSKNLGNIIDYIMENEAIKS